MRHLPRADAVAGPASLCMRVDGVQARLSAARRGRRRGGWEVSLLRGRVERCATSRAAATGAEHAGSRACDLSVLLSLASARRARRAVRAALQRGMPRSLSARVWACVYTPLGARSSRRMSQQEGVVRGRLFWLFFSRRWVQLLFSNVF